MIDILMSETCWAHNKWNKIASDIKLVFYSSTFKYTLYNVQWYKTSWLMKWEGCVTSRQVGTGTHLGLRRFGRWTQQSNIIKKKKREKHKEKVFLYKPRRHTGGEQVQLHSPLSSAFDGNKWTSRSGRFTPRKKEPRYSLNSRLGGGPIAGLKLLF